MEQAQIGPGLPTPDEAAGTDDTQERKRREGSVNIRHAFEAMRSGSVALLVVVLSGGLAIGVMHVGFLLYGEAGAAAAFTVFLWIGLSAAIYAGKHY